MAQFRPGAGRLTNDIAMGMIVVAVIALMVLPLPLWLIDTLLAAKDKAMASGAGEAEPVRRHEFIS